MLVNIDMDGVLTNWDLAALRLLGESDQGRDEPFDEFIASRGHTQDHLWRRIQGSEDFWEMIPLLPGARKLLRTIEEDHDATLCTSPGPLVLPNGKNNWEGQSQAIRGKLAWLSKHELTSIPFVPISDKWKLAGEGRVLIDDTRRQVDSWVENGGIAILFPTLDSGVTIDHVSAVDWVLDELKALDASDGQPRLIQYDDSNNSKTSAR